MFRKFYPTVYHESAYSIDFRELFHKGYRGILIDIDNTLVEHGAPSNDQSEAFFKMLHETGFQTCILSNNHEPRVRPFADAVQSSYICDAGKPGSSGYLKGMKLMDTGTNNTFFIGDQMFTDIWGANNSGIPSILVKPIKIDPKFLILLKRVGEAIVKRFYFRYARRHPSEL